MKPGDLVWHIDPGRRAQWGTGIITEVHPSYDHTDIPYISVLWSKVKKETRNHTCAYIEVLS